MAGQYPGLAGGSGRQMPGGDPVVPPALVSSMLQQEISKVATAAQQEAMLAGEGKKLLEAHVERVLTEMVTDWFKKIDKYAIGHRAMIGLRDRMVPLEERGVPVRADPSPAPQQAPAAQRAPVTPQRASATNDLGLNWHEVDQAEPTPPSPPTPTPPGPGFRAQFAEGRATAQKNMTMSKITTAAAKFISEQNPTWETAEDGTLIQKDQMGNVIAQVSPDDPNYENIGRKIRMSGYITSQLGRYAEGTALKGALGAFTKVAGPLGMAVGAWQYGSGQVQKQQEKGAEYRQDFGGEGTSFFSAADRFGEWRAGLKGSLGLSSQSGARAREQFKQASALGLRGDRRDEAREFASRMYGGFGMDTADAMQIVENTIKDGNLSLLDYSNSIREVSKAAVEAGRSSEDAIKAFAASQHLIAGTVVAGSASAGISSQTAQIAARLPEPVLKMMGGQEGLSALPGNQQAMQMIAMATGLDPMASQFRLQAGGRTSEREAARLLTGGAEVVVNNVAAVFGMTGDQLRAEANEEAGGSGELTNDQMNDLWLRWSGGSEATAGMMLQSLAVIMRAYGYPDAGPEMLHTFFQMALGAFNVKASAGKDGRGARKGRLEKGPVGKSGTKVTTRDPWGAGTTESNIKYRKDGGAKQESSLLSAMGYAKTFSSQGAYGGSVTNQQRPEDTAGFKAYAGLVNKTGVGNEAIQRLLSGEGAVELEKITGKKDAGDVKYRVYDGNKAKTVSLAEAVNNPAYRSQLVSGRAGVFDKHGELESVSEITNIKSKSQAVPGGSKGGDKGGGKVTHKTLIDLTPRAARLLKIDGPTDSERNGTPTDSVLNPNNYPTYGGW